MTHPKIIAHRGFKAKYAENTLAAFKGAVAVGAEILETDVQVTFDGIVVINHDPTTGRVYDENLIIADTTLEKLKSLKHKGDPTQRILTLVEFLEWVSLQKKELQIMLDIKSNNDVTVIAKIIRALLDINPDYSYWYPKVIFGLWRLDFYRFGVETTLLSNFQIINISISPTISKSFIDYSETVSSQFKLSGVSLLTLALYAPEFEELNGQTLKPKGIKLFIWTSNTAVDFAQAYHWNAFGIITDRPDEAIAFTRQAEESSNETDSLLSDHGVKFVVPSFFSSDGVKLNLRFGLFRLFEFLVLNNLMGFRPLQKALFGIVRVVVG